MRSHVIHQLILQPKGADAQKFSSWDLGRAAAAGRIFIALAGRGQKLTCVEIWKQS
jgi:hypothetical protein